MNKKQVFEAINVYHKLANSDFSLSENADHLIFSLGKEDVICESKFRCQSYGSITFLKPKGNVIINNSINSIFESLIVDELKFKLKPGLTTFARASGHFKTAEIFDDFQISTDEALNEVITFIELYLSEVKQTFFDPAKDITYLAKLVAEKDFENQNETLVGGKFPTHIMKKIFFLKKGRQEERYQEYKEGLKMLLKRYEEKKPLLKEEVKIYWKGYNYFIEKLESEIKPSPFSGPV